MPENKAWIVRDAQVSIEAETMSIAMAFRAFEKSYDIMEQVQFRFFATWNTNILG